MARDLERIVFVVASAVRYLKRTVFFVASVVRYLKRIVYIRCGFNGYIHICRYRYIYRYTDTSERLVSLVASVVREDNIRCGFSG